jgi:signal transduction histidine kinase
LNRDLISLLALPTMWPVAAPRGPTAVVELLLDVLLSMLRLDFVFVRIPRFEAARVDGITDHARCLEVTRAALDPWLAEEPGDRPKLIAHPLDNGGVRLATFRLGNAEGLLVAASRRPAFPDETEGLLLRVAVNQVITGLEAARHLELERHRSEQLQKLAGVSLEIHSSSSADEILEFIAERARDIVGSRRAVTSMTAKQELEPVPRRDRIAAPIVDREGRTIGVIELTEKNEGEFSETDQAVLVQLARQASAAIVNAHLYDQLFESEKALRAADRRKDEFLAMLSHELRNPLSPILTALQLMELRGQARTREYDIIERQVRHMARLVDDLLDVSRITGGKVVLKRETVELSTIIARAIEMASPMLEQRSHTLTVAAARTGLLVHADPGRLAQVFGNLLTNAAKYTEPGGSISVRALRRGEELVVSVKDNGMGIGPDLLPQIFEVFVQGARTLDRAQGGLGLGLHLTRTLVKLHDGSVTAHSEGHGAGSEFVVVLPAVGTTETPADESRPMPVDRPKSTSGVRVLIVDDNEDAAGMLSDALAEIGFQVAVAYDGREALRIAVDFKPQAALIDIGLPVMDGYELARKLGESLAGERPRLVAITGYGLEHDRSRAHAAGFDAHLVKPVETRVVAQEILESHSR